MFALQKELSHTKPVNPGFDVHRQVQKDGLPFREEQGSHTFCKHKTTIANITIMS